VSADTTGEYRKQYISAAGSVRPSPVSDPFPAPAAPRHRRLVVHPKGITGTTANGSDVSGVGFMSVSLRVPADAASQPGIVTHSTGTPSGWSLDVFYSLTLVSQTDERCNVKKGPTFNNFRGSASSWVNTEFLKPTALNDVSKGYIVNDTLIIKCDMTNVSNNALTQRETGIVDADTAAAAAISAAYPGTFLPAAAAALAAANPGAVPGAAPRVASPAGLYPTSAGGLL